MAAARELELVSRNPKGQAWIKHTFSSCRNPRQVLSALPRSMVLVLMSSGINKRLNFVTF